MKTYRALYYGDSTNQKLHLFDKTIGLELIGKISNKAIWIKGGQLFVEEDINILYKLTYEWFTRAGNHKGFWNIPKDAQNEDIEDLAQDKLNRYGGDKITWDLDYIEVDYVQIRCKCCNQFI